MSRKSFDKEWDSEAATTDEDSSRKMSESSAPLLSEFITIPRAPRRWVVLKTLFLLALTLSAGLLIGFLSSPRLPPWARRYFDQVSKHGPQSPLRKIWSGHKPQVEVYDQIPLGKACQAIPHQILSAMRGHKSPAVRVVAENGTLIPDGASLDAPSAVCILYAIPQVQPTDDVFTDLPVSGKGPDIVHMYLNASDVIVTFPPLRPLPNQPQASMQYSKDCVIYYAETTIWNNGTYHATAEQEFSNWRWAQEWHQDPITHDFIYVTGNDVKADILDAYKWAPQSLPNVSFSANGPRRMPSRPTCDAENIAGVGRWYSHSAFPNIDESLVDEWGYSWQGDFCQIDYFTPTDVMDCLSEKTIHMYGDSMTRRLAKSLLAGGKWCMDVNGKCQDEDDAMDAPITLLNLDDEGGLVFDSVARDQHFQFGNTDSIGFGKNSSLYFSFLSSITNSTKNWMEPLYDQSDVIDLPDDADEDRALLPGAVARPPPTMRKADLVILGLGAWDQAFTHRFDHFERRLTEFRDALLHAYPDTPIILRLSNSWCCRGTANGFRRYTGGRIQEFDDRIRKVFRVQGGSALDGRILIMDPMAMNGRPNVLFDYKTSNANHPRASHVRTEMQMMLNSLCERDPASGFVSSRLL